MPGSSSALRNRIYAKGLGPFVDVFAAKFGSSAVMPRVNRKRCPKGLRVGPGKSGERSMVNYRNVCAGTAARKALRKIRTKIIKGRKYHREVRVPNRAPRSKRKLSHKLRLWIHALKYVKKKAGITGFVKISKSHKLYRKVRHYYDFLLARYPEKSVSSRSLKRFGAARSVVHRAVLRRIANRRRKVQTVRKASSPRRRVTRRMTRMVTRAMAAPRRSSRRR